MESIQVTVALVNQSLMAGDKFSSIRYLNDVVRYIDEYFVSPICITPEMRNTSQQTINDINSLIEQLSDESMESINCSFQEVLKHYVVHTLIPYVKGKSIKIQEN